MWLRQGLSVLVQLPQSQGLAFQKEVPGTEQGCPVAAKVR